MIKGITIIAGLLLGIVGLLGFVAPNLIGMNVSTGQSILYLFSGALALYFGLAVSPPPSRTFCVLFGTFYTFIGLAGFAFGGPDHTLTIVPGHLVFESMDHVFHVVLGAIVLAAGLSGRMAAPIGPPSPNK